MIKRFWCKLWGHKFLSKIKTKEEWSFPKSYKYYERIKNKECPRCGEELGKE